MDQLLIGDVIRTAADRVPDEMCAALDGVEVTFAEVSARAERMALALVARGVGRGDRVLWWADTTLDVIPLYFATAHIGAILVPLNPRYVDDETDAIVERVTPAIWLHDDGHRGDVTIAELEATPLPAGTELPAPDEYDGHIIFFTSGTTGAPKGVVLSQRAERLRAGYGTWPTGPIVCMFPQFHMAGWAHAIKAWLHGDGVVYVNRPDAENLLGAVERYRCRQMYCIPAVWRRIMEADWRSYDRSSLTAADTGTSATTPELLAGIQEVFPGATTSIAYGSTEAESVCMLWPQDIFTKPGSVGRPSAGVHVKLDPETGEMLVRSPYLFSCYYGDEAATQAAFTDGWFRTGDLAERDADGCYSIVGRAKDLIRTGGETVAPVEVDLVIQRHPAVADAAVAGVPHDDWGEVIYAFVVPKPGHTVELADLRKLCEASLASHKHPRQLVVVDAIPRTQATGQVQRRALTQLAQETDAPQPA